MNNKETLFKEKQFTWNVTVYLGYVLGGVVALASFATGASVWALIGLVLVGSVYFWKLGRDRTTYTLTSESVIIEKGILNTTIRKVPLTKIQDVTFKQGFIQKQFNTGDLFLESAGESGGGMPIKDILDPHNRMEQILELVQKK